MRAYKNGEDQKVWDPMSTEGDPNDPCLKREHALDNYGDCCGRGNYEKAGHLPVCQDGKQCRSFPLCLLYFSFLK
mgnify:CR=1 FL=1